MRLSPRDRRKQAVRSDIIATTLEIISETGLDAASIEAIADGAGVARATIYAHFPDGRNEILCAAYDRAGEIVVETARGEVKDIPEWDARIVSYARTMMRLSSSSHFGRFYSLTGPSLVGFRATGGAGSRGYRELIREELEAAIERDELRDGIDPEPLAVLLSSSLRDAGIAVAREPASVGRFVAAIEMILGGLRRTHRDEQE